MEVGRDTAEEVAGHAVVARGRVGPGAKGEGASGASESPPRGPTRPSELPPPGRSGFREFPPVGRVARVYSRVAFRKGPSRPSRPSRGPSRVSQSPQSRVPVAPVAFPVGTRNVLSAKGDSEKRLHFYKPVAPVAPRVVPTRAACGPTRLFSTGRLGTATGRVGPFPKGDWA